MIVLSVLEILICNKWITLNNSTIAQRDMPQNTARNHVPVPTCPNILFVRQKVAKNLLIFDKTFCFCVPEKNN